MSTLLNKKKKNIVLIILSFIIVGIILFVYFNRPQADTKSTRTETVPSDKGKLIGNISGEIDLNKQVYIDLNGQESSHIYVQNDGYFQADDLTPGQYIYTVYDDDSDFALPDVTEPYVYIKAGTTEYLGLKNVKKYDNEYRNPIKPAITSFSPTSGKVGDKVTVKGSQIYIDSLFFINEVRVADSAFITPEESTIIIPQGATTGKVSVSGNDYTAQSSSDFTVTTPPPPAVLPPPTFNIPAGTYTTPQTVNISAESDATIYYTKDNTEPILSSPTMPKPYPSAISIDKTTTLKAKAYKDNIWSTTATAVYTINIPPPPNTPSVFKFIKPTSVGVTVTRNSKVTLEVKVTDQDGMSTTPDRVTYQVVSKSGGYKSPIVNMTQQGFTNTYKATTKITLPKEEYILSYTAKDAKGVPTTSSPVKVIVK